MTPTILWQHRSGGRRAVILRDGREIVIRIATPKRVQSYRVPEDEAGELARLASPLPSDP